MIRNTGVRVTEDHRAIALERAQGVTDTPIIIVHEVEMHTSARADFGEWLDDLAQAYGLPAPSKNSDGDTIHYGMEPSGEFTFWDADADECPDQDILST